MDGIVGPRRVLPSPLAKVTADEREWVAEVPGANCQEESRAGLVESLRVTLDEASKFNRAEARRAAGKGYRDLTITPGSAANSSGSRAIEAAVQTRSLDLSSQSL